MFKVCVKEGLWRLIDEYYVDSYVLAFNKFEEWFRLYNYKAKQNPEKYPETKILIQNDFTNEVYAAINVIAGVDNE